MPNPSGSGRPLEAELAAGTIPQLEMRRGDLGRLPPLEVPDGFTCRTLDAAEEPAWIRVLNACADLGSWDAARAERALARGIALDRVWILWRGSTPVSTACVCLWEGRDRKKAEIGWVAVDRDFQGRRLGRGATLAACHQARQLGFDEVFLLTDDFRLPAIRTYLRLGFRPEPSHPGHPARWDAILRTARLEHDDSR